METVERTKRIGVLSVLDRSGDMKLVWDAENAEEVEAARALFDSLKEKRYIAYSVTGKKGEKGEVIKEFDPELEMIIMSPPLVGG